MPDDEKGQTCEKCSRWFAWPFVGAQPESGDYLGVPLCPDCYIDEEPRDGLAQLVERGGRRAR